MKAQSRIGDMSHGSGCDVGDDCCPHSWTGPIISGAKTFFTDNKNTSRIGDIGRCNCPHGGVYIIICGASHTVTEGSPNSRLGDKVLCLVCGDVGRIIEGAPTTFVE